MNRPVYSGGPPPSTEPPEGATYDDAVLAFLMYAATGKQEYHWAVFGQLQFVMEQRWEELWSFIVALTQAADTNDPDVFSFIAAGPLEDLLSRAGQEYIELVEAEAAKSDRFRRILSGVWQSTIPDDLWLRIRRATSDMPSSERL